MWSWALDLSQGDSLGEATELVARLQTDGHGKAIEILKRVTASDSNAGWQEQD